MFYNIKNDILKEIRSLIPEGSTHRFNEKFYVHYIEGEVATTETCSAIKVSHGGMVSIIVYRDTESEDEVIDGEAVFNLDSCTFVDILNNLKKEIREKRLSHLREIVKHNGGKVEFDGSFDFFIRLDNDYICQLNALRITKDGNIEVDNTCDGDKFTNPEEELSDKNLDKLIAYVESQTKRKFVVRVYGTYSRTFDIEASSYEEALAEAKKDLEINPIRWDDLDEGNWEDFTSRSN